MLLMVAVGVSMGSLSRKFGSTHRHHYFIRSSLEERVHGLGLASSGVYGKRRGESCVKEGMASSGMSGTPGGTEHRHSTGVL